MKAYIVELDDDPSALVQLTEAIAGKGANLTAVSIIPGRRQSIGFIADNEEAVGAVLAGLDLPSREYDVIPMSIPNESGALARAAHALEAAGTPIQLLLTLRATRGHVVDMIAVPDPGRARLVVQGLPEDGLID